ncbi:hypothetical protein Tco_0270044 [Tanacetum coccineum]
MIALSLLTEMKIDIGDIIYNDLVTRLTNTPRKKYVAYLRSISCVLERLLNTYYTQDAALGSTPLVLTSMSPTPSLEKVGKKKKSQTITKPKPTSYSPEASGVPPKVTKGKRQSKTKQSSLIQTNLKLTKEKEPLEGTDTSL